MTPDFTKLKAIIFDFDGVILESAGIKTDAFADLADDYPAHRDAFIAYHQAHLGISRYEKFRWLYEDRLGQPFTDEARARLGARFSELVVARILKCPFVPGALELLQAMEGRMPAFVASGTPQAELEHIIEARSLTRYFTEIWGTPHLKLDIINNIRARYGYEADEVVMVGDGLSDYRAAVAVRIPFIGRTTADNAEQWQAREVLQVPDMITLTEQFVAIDRLTMRSMKPYPHRPTKEKSRSTFADH